MEYQQDSKLTFPNDLYHNIPETARQMKN